MLDIVIVGSGPAGLAAALAAKSNGLDYVVLERGVLADTIHNFPLGRRLFSTADELELAAGDFDHGSKPTREDLLRHYSRVAIEERINIRLNESVVRIARSDAWLNVETEANEYVTRTVILAVGGFGKARRLNVPGESESRVTYRFVEPYRYAAKSALVIGGGNSAVEAALSLAEAGSPTTLAVRRASVRGRSEGSLSSPIKPWVLEALESSVEERTIRMLTSATVVAIEPRAALIRIGGKGLDRTERVECDHVFALIGADPDTSLLESAGAEIDMDGRPVYDFRTYETSVPGLFVSGHLTRERHIKNALEVSRRIVAYIAMESAGKQPVAWEGVSAAGLRDSSMSEVKQARRLRSSDRRSDLGYACRESRRPVEE